MWHDNLLGIINYIDQYIERDNIEVYCGPYVVIILFG